MTRQWSAAPALALSLAAVAAGAQPADLSSPIDCRLGTDCHIQQAVDRDAGPGARDADCGTLSYDGHKGVDFALPSAKAAHAGVAVLAVADGRVRATRDGMPDIFGAEPDAAAIAGRECGNGIVIDHGGGWTSQYCHLRQGTVGVAEGERVARGQRLGLVGQSGLAAFPHVHLQIRQGDTVIDPFDGQPMTAACGSGASAPLWAAGAGVTLPQGGTVSAGMLDRLPDYAEVEATAPHLDRMTPDAGALVFWAHFFGLRAGDVISSRLAGPDGAVVAEDRYEMPRDRATQFRAVGRRRPPSGWPEGRYDGQAQLLRGGQVVATIARQLEVQP